MFSILSGTGVISSSWDKANLFAFNPTLKDKSHPLPDFSPLSEEGNLQTYQKSQLYEGLLLKTISETSPKSARSCLTAAERRNVFLSLDKMSIVYVYKHQLSAHPLHNIARSPPPLSFKCFKSIINREAVDHLNIKNFLSDKQYDFVSSGPRLMS